MAVTHTSGWRFSHKVMLPVLFAIVITVGTVAGFVIWSTSRTDEHALARETALVAKAMTDQLANMPRVQGDFAVWDEALDAVENRDIEWLDTNMGGDIFEGYGHNRNYILDADLHPVYAMRDGGQVAGKAFETVRSTIQPMIDKLRNLDGTAAIAAYNSGVSNTPPSVVDFALIEGRPAMLSVMPMLSDSGDEQVAPGREPIYISAMLLDDALAAELTDQYLFGNAHFATTPELGANEAAYPIRNADGDIVAWFKWQPNRPGARILQDTLPALLLAAAVAGGIIALLLRNLQRASTQLQSERAEAQHRALHDPLTGLGNRALFRDRLHQAVATMSRGEPRLALLALDLDRFKQVNDSLGHEAGDELLRQVAGRITSLLRPSDTLVRLGGDEFAIIQTGITAHAEATALSQRVIDAVQAPFYLLGRSVQIGVSIGIVTAPDLAQTEAEMAARADDALYRAKEGGRNRFCIHPAQPQGDTNADLEQQVREAFAPRRTDNAAA
ncbi:diguanylate cyclase domain-containing protein [Devosia sp.]|uniref:diguanylate cyclase domain-containing protein n=1 Tax=Devosia sp. TaxID=1871048 RepID=UPI003264FA12